MEINVNSKSFGTVGMDLGNLDANSVGSRGDVKGASEARRETQDAVTFAQPQPVGLASSEPVAEVPDTALLRDDALGKFVSAAFSLPPPPMPAFGE